MDTWSASQYNNSVGVVWGVPIKYTEPVCQLMQEAGVRNIRVEVGWSNIDFDDQLTSRAKTQLETQLLAFKRHGIRPLILLNANDGVPGPVRSISVTVAAPAPKGSSTVQLSDYSAVRPGYSGFGFGRAGFPFITSIDSEGTAHLSAPLPQNVPAGAPTDTRFEISAVSGERAEEHTALYRSFRGYLSGLDEIRCRRSGDGARYVGH